MRWWGMNQLATELREAAASARAFADNLGSTELKRSFREMARRARIEGKVILGDDYLREWALPNIYFHVTTAYDILRHNGVELGKRDFVGSLTTRDAT